VCSGVYRDGRFGCSNLIGIATGNIFPEQNLLYKACKVVFFLFSSANRAFCAHFYTLKMCYICTPNLEPEHAAKLNWERRTPSYTVGAEWAREIRDWSGRGKTGLTSSMDTSSLEDMDIPWEEAEELAVDKAGWCQRVTQRCLVRSNIGIRQGKDK